MRIYKRPKALREYAKKSGRNYDIFRYKPILLCF